MGASNVTSKTIKTTKTVKKTIPKTERHAGAAVKKTAVKAKTKAKAKTVAPVKVPAKTALKPVAAQKATAKSGKPAAQTQLRKAPAAHAVPAAPQPATKPVATRPKPGTAQVHGSPKTAAVPRASAPHPAPRPARPVAAARPLVIKKDPRLANNWKTKPVEQWIDDEVICMPDEQYMSDKQLAFFRLKLVRLKNDILSNAGETTEHLRSDTVVVPDPADRATIEDEHALELRTRDRERKLLRKIEQSIARIDTGDYGYCDETGEPIGIARLLARPTATLSLEAQQRRELKQKLFGD
ncbi:MAG: RNA polymerase-binding protein DksA [Burkholderiaceae bacterium]|jgi:DnaK suppressor protein|nr:RNA polymerase-binding protein DksA [Burkholderiaceae bacterium]